MNSMDLSYEAMDDKNDLEQQVIDERHDIQIAEGYKNRKNDRIREDKFFGYFKNNNSEAVFNAITKDLKCLYYRDAVGGTPVHIAYLYRNYELGRRILDYDNNVGTLTYTLLGEDIMRFPCTVKQSDRIDGSPYEGQNLLHMAIMHREPELAGWLIEKFPILIDGHLTGEFFEPHRNNYFGSTPLLCALSTNQIEIAKKILIHQYISHQKYCKPEYRSNEYGDLYEDKSKYPKSKKYETQRASKSEAIISIQEESAKDFDASSNQSETKLEDLNNSFPQKCALTIDHSSNHYTDNIRKYGNAMLSEVRSHDNVHHKPQGITQTDKPCWQDAEQNYHFNRDQIFLPNQYGHTVLHLAVLHNLPAIYDFAINYAMEMLTVKNQDIPKFVNKLTEMPSLNDEGKFWTLSHCNLIDFLKKADDHTYKKMINFLYARDKDDLSPLSLAATIGCAEMFQHIIKKFSIDAWDYGPTRAYYIPIFDLEVPVPYPESYFRRHGRLQHLLRKLPFPFGPRCYGVSRSAIYCLCSYDVLSSSLINNSYQMEKIHKKRVKMLSIYEVRQIMEKKWNCLYKRRFLIYYAFYCVYLVTLMISLIIGGFGKVPHSLTDLASWSTLGWLLSRLSDLSCVSLAMTKLIEELNGLVFHFWGYVHESGAPRVNNIVSLIATVSTLIAFYFKVFEVDAVLQVNCTAVAIIFGWLYHFYFFLGSRTTGPFIIMIMHMISTDLTRFSIVFIVVLTGFTQAHFLLLEGSTDISKLSHSMGQLLVSGIVGEVDFEANYGKKSYIIQWMMWLFLVLVLILLLNLLIAMMGNTYQNILDHATELWTVEQGKIMETFRSYHSEDTFHEKTYLYGLPIEIRERKSDKHDIYDFYIQIEIYEVDVWRQKIM